MPAAQEVSAGPRAGKEGGGRAGRGRGKEGGRLVQGGGGGVGGWGRGTLRESKELRDAEDPAMPPLGFENGLSCSRLQRIWAWGMFPACSFPFLGCFRLSSLR